MLLSEPCEVIHFFNKINTITLKYSANKSKLKSIETSLCLFWRQWLTDGVVKVLLQTPLGPLMMGWKNLRPLPSKRDSSWPFLFHKNQLAFCDKNLFIIVINPQETTPECFTSILKRSPYQNVGTLQINAVTWQVDARITSYTFMSTFSLTCADKLLDSTNRQHTLNTAHPW